MYTKHPGIRVTKVSKAPWKKKRKKLTPLSAKIMVQVCFYFVNCERGFFLRDWIHLEDVL